MRSPARLLALLLTLGVSGATPLVAEWAGVSCCEDEREVGRDCGPDENCQPECGLCVACRLPAGERTVALIVLAPRLTRSTTAPAALGAQLFASPRRVFHPPRLA